jgi:UDP-N-acetylmuramyl pentapeptide phosphotransferase/UDP-N-acetylglucosamine-1-phosphate transferase
MNMKLDPYALGFAVVMHLFIVPWLFKHFRKPRPNLPPSIKAAANILLTTGGVFIILGAACGILFTDLPRPWRFVWIGVASIGGALWIWNAFRLRDGIHSARWASIPCLLAAIPCLPLLGWIAVPIATYCLFLNKKAKQFFKEEQVIQLGS